MLATAQKSGHARADQPARATLCAAPIQITAAGLQHDAAERGPTRNRGRSDCLRRSSLVAGAGSSEASRKTHSQSGRYLGQVRNARHILHWVGGHAYFGIYCNFHPVSVSLSGSTGHARGDIRNLCLYNPLAASLEHSGRYAALCHGHDGKPKGSNDHRTGSHRGTGTQGRRRHNSKQPHTYALWPRSVCRLLPPHRVNSFGRNLGGPDYVLIGGLYEPCSDGLGGGRDRGGAGAFAKVFLLDSVGISRMEKAGEYGNRLSRTSATLAVRP